MLFCDRFLCENSLRNGTVCLLASHFLAEILAALDKEWVVVRASLPGFFVVPLKTPEVELALKGFILCLLKMVLHNFFDKGFRDVDLNAECDQSKS